MVGAGREGVDPEVRARGACLDEFELQAMIGRGGMSVVYRARDLLLDRDVAVKVLSSSWAGADAPPDTMLECEARATARLRHPSIVTIHRVGRHQGRLYLVLELLEGETLAARLRQGPLGEEEASAIALELLAALAHAHAHGIVHRDVKPGNVFVEASGSVKVLDFGLSGRAATPAHDGLAAIGREPVAGTPAYMAPELWRGQQADERTDVYAAGVVLYELMAASAPARARAPARDQIEDIAARAAAPDRDDRFGDAGEMAAALRAVLGAAGRRRAPRRMATGALVALMLAAAAAIGAGPLDRQPAAPDLSGTRKAEPAGFGQAVLRRIGPDLYSREQTNSPARVDEGTFFSRGTLELRRAGDTFVHAGNLADVPGWCCGNVGEVELELTRPGELRVTRSLWGERRGEYSAVHAPCWFLRQPR